MTTHCRTAGAISGQVPNVGPPRAALPIVRRFPLGVCRRPCSTGGVLMFRVADGGLGFAAPVLRSGRRPGDRRRCLAGRTVSTAVGRRLMGGAGSVRTPIGSNRRGLDGSSSRAWFSAFGFPLGRPCRLRSIRRGLSTPGRLGTMGRGLGRCHRCTGTCCHVQSERSGRPGRGRSPSFERSPLGLAGGSARRSAGSRTGLPSDGSARPGGLRSEPSGSRFPSAASRFRAGRDRRGPERPRRDGWRPGTTHHLVRRCTTRRGGRDHRRRNVAIGCRWRAPRHANLPSTRRRNRRRTRDGGRGASPFGSGSTPRADRRTSRRNRQPRPRSRSPVGTGIRESTPIRRCSEPSSRSGEENSPRVRRPTRSSPAASRPTGRRCKASTRARPTAARTGRARPPTPTRRSRRAPRGSRSATPGPTRKSRTRPSSRIRRRAKIRRIPAGLRTSHLHGPAPPGSSS